jgi:hypothetical protein
MVLVFSLTDVSVIEAFESRVLDLRDFYFAGYDYRYHFAKAKRRFMNLLKQQSILVLDAMAEP